MSYIALSGFDIDKPKIRVEAGEAVPDKVPQKEIKALLEAGAIREASEDSRETDAGKVEAD